MFDFQTKELSCADYKAVIFLIYGWQHKKSVTKTTENIKRELLGPGYTKHSSSPKPAKSPAHCDAAPATKLLLAFEIHTGFILFLPFWIKCCATCGHIKVSLGILGPEAIWSVSNMGTKKWHFCEALLPLKFHSWTHMSWCTTQGGWWVLSLKQGIFNKTISCII